MDLRKTIYNTSAHDTVPITAQDAQKAINEGAAASAAAGTSGKKTYSCEVCNVDCTKARYHSLKNGKYVICVACYQSGRFPSTMHSGGFVRMDDEAFKHGTAADAGDWSDQETLLLLEGIEMYDEDWIKIAEHVGTRSKEQCVMHFLQLPIEDEYLDEPQASLGPLKFTSGVQGSAGLPFSKADNPVMSVVAFLASAVGPGVAAAAAQRALGELTDGLGAGIKKSEQKAGEEAQAEKDKADAEEAKDKETPDAERKDEDETMEGVGKQTDGQDVEMTSGEEDKAQVGETKQDGAADSTSTTNPTAASSGIPQSHIQHVAELALGAAAAKASALAVHEERHLESLVNRLVAAQMKKLELKLSMFEKFEELLEQEKRQLEIQKQQFFKDKLSLQSQLKNAQELLAKAQSGQNVPQVAADVAKAAEAATSHSTAESVTQVPVDASGAPATGIPTDGTIQPLS